MTLLCNLKSGCDTSSVVLFAQDCFGSLGSFVLFYELLDDFSISVKTFIGIFMWTALNL
jgi:hypothetical protein